MDVGETADGPAVPLRVHNLLLALAGRVDDSALTSAHELVARSDVAEAVELTVGTLIAGRIPVRESERRELVSLLELSRCDPSLVDELVVDELRRPAPHRFSGAVAGHDAPEAGIAEAIERPVRVLPDVRTVRAVWRLTPAGSVPGPLPARVVLIEAGPDANPPAVAYRIDTALQRAGIDAVVEVLGSEEERSWYHDWALGSSRSVYDDSSTLAEFSSARAPERESSRIPARNGPRGPRIGARRAQHDIDEPAALSFDEPDAAVTDELAPVTALVSSPDSVGFPTDAQVTDAQSTEASSSEPPIVESSALDSSGESQSSGAQSPEPPLSEVPVPEVSPTEAHWEPESPWQPGDSAPAASTGPADSWSSDDSQPSDDAGSGDDAGPGEPAPLAEPFATSQPWSSAFVESEVVAGDGADQQQQDRVASTTEMTPAEMAQLRQALAEDPEKGRQIAASVRPGEVVEIPELDLDDPQLSERDRELLRELHAELAARERTEAGRHGVNGSQSG